MKAGDKKVIQTNMTTTFALIAITMAVTMMPANGQIFTHTYNLISPPSTFHHAIAGIVQAPMAIDTRGLAHRAVVENALAESQLPPELLNPFYKNPRIAAGLAKESWYGDKEFPVLHREADKIPRSEILKIVRRIQHLDRKR